MATTPESPKPWLPANVYDALKLLAQIILPSLATLYFALSGIWGLPDAEKVIGTITALDTFFGILLSISKAQYLGTDAAYDGHVNLEQDGEGNTTVKFNVDPADILKKDQLTLKVGSP